MITASNDLNSHQFSLAWILSISRVVLDENLKKIHMVDEDEIRTHASYETRINAEKTVKF